ncbi:MAG: glycoside-pentoside-hexuronide (GPH):cation symporter [Sphingomonadales bacterium]|nr:glycoside-pentoside-hexuronide (GPH):cation symporter [Sphingomonadales bacterium]
MRDDGAPNPRLEAAAAGRLSWRARVGFGIGDYGLNLYWQAIGFYLFYFYTDVVGLSAAVTGLIYAIGGVWDAVSDPAMGYVAERTRSRWGSYRPYLLFGAVPLALAFAAMFTVPGAFSGTAMAVAAGATLLLYHTAYTAVSIPYSSLGARVSYSSRERTKLAGTRMYFAFLGGVSVIALAGTFRNLFDPPAAFGQLAVACGVLSVIALLICFHNTTEQPLVSAKSRPAVSLRELLVTVVRNRPFLLVLGGILFVTVGMTFITKTALYHFEYALGDRAAGDVALFILAGAPLITIPVWSLVAVKIGKRNTWLAGSAVSMIGLAALYLDRTGSVDMALLTYGLISLGISSYAVAFWSMLPDTIEYGEYRTGVRNEAVVIGLVSSSQKGALAGSALMLGLLLEFISYRPGIPQSAETLQGLRSIITLVPIAAIACGVAVIASYPISTRVHREIVTALASRSRAGDQGHSAT